MIGVVMLSVAIGIVAVAAWFTWIDRMFARGEPLSFIGVLSCWLVGALGFATTLTFGMGW